MKTSPTSVDRLRAASLLQRGPLQQRSLSLPFSRIVLNPQSFIADTSEVEQNCDETMPLGLGYYAHDRAITIPRFLTLWRRHRSDATMPSIPPQRVEAAGWTALDEVVVDSSHGSRLHLTLPAGASAHGRATTRLSLTEDRPVLRMAVSDVEGQLSVELTQPDGTVVQILPGAAMTGIHTFDLRTHIAGKSGEWTLAVGVIREGTGARATIDEIAFVSAFDPAAHGAEAFDTQWSPGGLDMSAGYAAVVMSGCDTFVDEDSFVREFRFDEALDGDPALYVVGRHIGAPSFSAEDSVLTFAGHGLTASVCVPLAEEVRYFVDEAEFAAGGEGAASPRTEVGVWAARLLPGASVYRVGCSVDPQVADAADARARHAARASAQERSEHWNAQWDKFFDTLPQPRSFEILGVDPAGLAPRDVEEAYYRAYVGLYSNVLPAQPETGFDYPTVATGKASMWNHGSAGARSAAAWESFLAIQFLAFAAPDLAWRCFNGLLSRVDEEGSLGGESLPSHKAQTAAILYAITEDEAALREQYPALRRLLRWQAARPRWIYGTYDNAGEQDAEFLTYLIIDLEYAASVARTLGRHDDVVEYERWRDRLAHDYREHCFLGEDRVAVQHWFRGDVSAAMRGGPVGADLPVTAGLSVPELDAWQVASLLARFDSRFDAGDQLAGFDFVKHPNVSRTALGLLAHGRVREAQALTNALLRDVILSGSFAEVYDRGPERPQPCGVRPSIFGMTQVIEAVWLNNGFRADRAQAEVVVFPAACGGVSNILMRGTRIGIVVGDAPSSIGDEARR
jgi:hypothetical protein